MATSWPSTALHHDHSQSIPAAATFRVVRAITPLTS
jgi:hypothetical protein